MFHVKHGRRKPTVLALSTDAGMGIPGLSLACGQLSALVLGQAPKLWRGLGMRLVEARKICE